MQVEGEDYTMEYIIGVRLVGAIVPRVFATVSNGTLANLIVAFSLLWGNPRLLLLVELSAE